MADVAGKYPMGDDPLPAELNRYWEQFFKTEDTRPRGLDYYNEIFDSPLLFPLQRKLEMQSMLQVARRMQPKTVYEIGADKGGGFYHWCKCLPSVRRAIACEHRGTPYSNLFEAALPDIDFLWLPQSSYDSDTIAQVEQWLGEDPIDCLFIDGDKGQFLLDFDSYLPLMNPDGIVFMHDVVHPPPSDAFAEIIRRGYATQHLIDRSESEEAVSRQEAGIPAVGPYEGWLRYWHGRSCTVGIIYLSGSIP